MENIKTKNKTFFLAQSPVRAELARFRKESKNTKTWFRKESKNNRMLGGHGCPNVEWAQSPVQGSCEDQQIGGMLQSTQPTRPNGNEAELQLSLVEQESLISSK